VKELLNRVTRGDAIEILDDIPSQTIDLVVTDPPYGDNMGYGRYKRTIQGNAHPLVGLTALAKCYTLLKRNACAYMFLDMKHVPITRLFFEQYTDFRIRDILVWNKGHMGMGHGFRKQHELIIVLEKGKPVYRNLGMPNVLTIPRVDTHDHPHKKPVELIEKLILQSSDKGHIVLDPFLGSGTTAIAAYHLGRNFVGLEADTAFAEIAMTNVNKAMCALEPCQI
jgi:DNA modification methylase